MRTFLIRLLVNAVALWVATLVVSGIKLESDTAATHLRAEIVIGRWLRFVMACRW
jgi:uncharacterized membrane protein YvlD (DUF360 family)